MKKSKRRPREPACRVACTVDTGGRERLQSRRLCQQLLDTLIFSSRFGGSKLPDCRHGNGFKQSEASEVTTSIASWASAPQIFVRAAPATSHATGNILHSMGWGRGHVKHPCRRCSHNCHRMTSLQLRPFARMETKPHTCDHGYLDVLQATAAKIFSRAAMPSLHQFMPLQATKTCSFFPARNPLRSSHPCTELPSFM